MATDFVASTRPGLGSSDHVVGEEGEALTEGLGVDEAQGFRVAGLAQDTSWPGATPLSQGKAPRSPRGPDGRMAAAPRSCMRSENSSL